MKSEFTKDWIIQNSIDICRGYDKGVLTLRALHYQLVGIGMTNDIQHYKKVVNAMTDARWDNLIDFDTFSDLDRIMVGETKSEETSLEEKVSEAKHQIDLWMRVYSKNRWENQPYYPEVFIEKKALQGVFSNICRRRDVALGACKGYPSLTFLYESSLRFKEAIENGKKPVIIYFGDYDPSGEDIPRSIKNNLLRLDIDVEVRRIALMEHQVLEWKLPPAPTKDTDTRSAKWSGIGQVELDAVKPEMIERLCNNAINDVFDKNLYDELMEEEESERESYKRELKEFVQSI